MSKSIVIGSDVNNPIFTFNDSEIESIIFHGACDLVGEELSSDTLDVSIFYNDADEELRNLPYATSISYYDGDFLVAKMFIEKIERTANARYSIAATSTVGLLGKEWHYGGMFRDYRLSEVITNIILTNGLSSSSYHQLIQFKSIVGDSYNNDTIEESIPAPSSTSSSLYAKRRAKVYLKFRLFSLQSSRIQIAGGIEIFYGAVRYIFGNKLFSLTPIASVGDMITVDVRPEEGKWYLSVEGGESYVTDISSIQSEQEYINNSYWTGAYNLRVPWSSTFGPIAEIYDYKVTNPNGTVAINLSYFYDVEAREMKIKNDPVNAFAANGSTRGGECVPTVGQGNIAPVSESMAQSYNSIKYDEPLSSRMKVFGWMQPGRKRDLLYQLLFSLGLNIKRLSGGKIMICALSADKVSDVDDDEVYDKGSIERVEKVKSISLTEHSFTRQMAYQTVFDNSGEVQPNGSYVINFDQAPILETPVAEGGLTLLASNCNAAVATGTGIVRARTYLHTTQDIEKQITNALDGREIKVQDATLVTSLNSRRVFERLLAYYGNEKQKIRNSIVLSNQSCGNKYGFLGPFNERMEAYLQKVTVTASETTKADCEFVQGYTPVEPGYDFNHYALLRSSGTWNTPANTERIRVILIGGGQGGGGGCYGQSGDNHSSNTEAIKVKDEQAKGGLAGQGGKGGKILIVDIESPASSYAYTIGTGGAGGGTSNVWDQPTTGALGTNSTFGSYSSANGNYVDTGYTDPFSGITYGVKAPDYENGAGDGGCGGYYTYDNSTRNLVYHAAQSRVNPLTGVSYAAGSKGTDSSGNKAGGGSGATCWSAGRNGSALSGGSGPSSSGRGKDGFPFGCGGYGGFGGAGGGCGGIPANSTTSYTPGIGGIGSISQLGGPGADGCILVYY